MGVWPLDTKERSTEVTLEILVRGVHEDICDRFRPNQIAQCHIYETTDLAWECIEEHGLVVDDPDITVSMTTDYRYALVKFELDKEKLLFKCIIHFYTRWLLLDEERLVDLTDPQGLSGLADWLVAEITDGLKRGWSGREEKRIA